MSFNLASLAKKQRDEARKEITELKEQIEKMKTLFEIIKNRSCTIGIYNIAVEGMELAK